MWVSVTIFWLSVAFFGWVWVDIGKYDHFFAGCGWVWVSVTLFGLVWVGGCEWPFLGGFGCVWEGVGECTIYNYLFIRL